MAETGVQSGMCTVWRTTLTSPLGDLQAVSSETNLIALGFAAQGRAHDPRMAQWATTPSGDPLRLAALLSRWFSGELEILDSLPLQPRGTAFQQQVWSTVQAIPAGQTLSYRRLAHRIGRPKAVRAVGAAVARNPVALAIPCHRVVGTRGQLTGYAWGLARKRSLLALEEALAPGAQLPLFPASQAGVPRPTPTQT